MRRVIFGMPWAIPLPASTLLSSPISSGCGLTVGSALMFPMFKFLTLQLPAPCTRGTGAWAIVSTSELSLMAFLLPLSLLFILWVTLYSFKERHADKGYVLPDSVVWDLGPTVQAHRVPKEMEGVQVAQNPAPKGLNDLFPEVLHCGHQLVLVPLIVAIACVLKCLGILHNYALLCGQLFVCVMVDLVVICLQDMGGM